MKTLLAIRFDNQLVHLQNQLSNTLRTSVRNIAFLLPFVLSFVVYNPAQAQSTCGCLRGPYNIGTTPNQVIHLTNWKAANPTFPVSEVNATCLYINGTLVIDTNFTLNGTAVKLAPGASIIVKSGVKLTLNKSTQLHACTNKLWWGITVEPGAELFMQKTSIIGAVDAVKADGNARITVLNSTFTDNITGLTLQHLSGGYGSSFVCENNNFKRTDALWLNDESSPVLAPWIGIVTNHVSEINLRRNKFSGLHCGLFLENTYKIHVSGGSWSDFKNLDGVMGQGIYAGSVTEAVFAEGAYTNVEIGIEAERSDIVFKGNTVQARTYGVLYVHSGGRSLRALANPALKGGQAGVLVQKCAVEGNAGLVEIGYNARIEGETGIAFDQVEIAYDIHDNELVRGYKYDGISLQQCFAPGSVTNNTVQTTGPVGDEALEMIYVNHCKVAGNTFSKARTGIALYKSQQNVFCCNALTQLEVGVYVLDSCMQTQFWNTTFGTQINTGLILFDQALISPQVNQGNDWSLSNCQVNALYMNAVPGIGPRAENQFALDPNLMPDGNQKIYVHYTDNAFMNQTTWFSLAGSDPSCPSDNQYCDGLFAKAEPGSATTGNTKMVNSLDAFIEETLEQVSQMKLTERGGDDTLTGNAWVFPNPAKTFFNVQWSDAVPGTMKFSLFKASGALIQTKTADSATQQIGFQVHSLSAGTYFLLIQFADGTSTRIKVNIVK